MINYETLLSTYDDKLTLMQWLKKVEAALKDASAVSFNVNKRGNATITFSVVFEDGSELETDPIILQQGESVTGGTITNGHLILTLSNGDTLDAGSVGAVSGFSINGSQHLVVTYQDGTTQDLGAIFSGNVNIAGTLTTSGDITSSGKITANGDLETTSAVRGLSAVITGNVNGSKFVGDTAMETIKDANGNKRFREDLGNPQTITGFTSTYCKWSLSGTHLLIVLAGTFANGTSLTSSSHLAVYDLPAWVVAKIFPVWDINIELKSVDLFASDWTNQQTTCVLQKINATQLRITNASSINLTADRNFRIEFDLLIDNE